MALNVTGSRLASLCYLSNKPDEFEIYIQNLVDGVQTPIPKERQKIVNHGCHNERITIEVLKEALSLQIWPQYRLKYVKDVYVFDRTVGAKSDGLYKRTIDDDTREYGILEIKSPYTSVHESIPPYYFAQMILEMKSCNRRNALFVSHFNVIGQKEEIRVWHISWDDAFWRQCELVFERLNLWVSGSSVTEICTTLQSFNTWAVSTLDKHATLVFSS